MQYNIFGWKWLCKTRQCRFTPTELICPEKVSEARNELAQFVDEFSKILDELFKNEIKFSDLNYYTLDRREIC